MTRGRYLTPDAFSGAAVCRPLFIPVELLPYVDGALEELTFTYNWEMFGGMTVDQTVDAVRSMIDSFYLDSCEATMSQTLTNDLSIPWSAMKVIAGNGLLRSPVTVGDALEIVFLQNAPAINDKLRWSGYLDAGVYRVTVKGVQNSASGQMHVQIGGTDYGVFDWYNGTQTIDVYQSTYIPVAAAGNVDLDFLMSTKLAASTNYGASMERFWIEKQ